MARLRAFGAFAVKCAALLCFAAYFVLTAVYCFPLNPLKERVEPFLDATIGRYFSQNWGLFAPTPVNANHVLLIQCLPPQESAPSPDRLPADQWTDITTPLILGHQGNRFSAYDRVGRTHMNLMRLYLFGGPGVAPYIEACEKGDHDACSVANDGLKAAHATIGPRLAMVASSVCRAGTNTSNATHVAIRIRQVPVRPWSKRSQSQDMAATDFDVGTFPVDRDVATTDLLKGS